MCDHGRRDDLALRRISVCNLGYEGWIANTRWQMFIASTYLLACVLVGSKLKVSAHKNARHHTHTHAHARARARAHISKYAQGHCEMKHVDPKCCIFMCFRCHDTHPCLNTHTHVLRNKHPHPHPQPPKNSSTQTVTHTHACASAHMHAPASARTQIRTRVRAHTRTHTHAHTRTKPLSRSHRHTPFTKHTPTQLLSRSHRHTPCTQTQTHSQNLSLAHTDMRLPHIHRCACMSLSICS